MSGHSRGRQWRVLMWLVSVFVCMIVCQHVRTHSGTSMACPHVVGKRVCMYDCCNMSQHSWGRQWRVLMWLVSVFVCMIVCKFLIDS